MRVFLNMVNSKGAEREYAGHVTTNESRMAQINPSVQLHTWVFIYYSGNPRYLTKELKSTGRLVQESACLNAIVAKHYFFILKPHFILHISHQPGGYLRAMTIEHGHHSASKVCTASSRIVHPGKGMSVSTSRNEADMIDTQRRSPECSEKYGVLPNL